MTRTIVLASSSPRRQELVRNLGLNALVIPSQVDEEADPGLAPWQIVEELALRKADSVAQKHEDAIVIGSDTIVVLDGDILGKPRDEADALDMLRRLQGRTHEVFSGIACVDARAKLRAVRHARTIVRMKPLSDEQIRRYIATGEPMDKAGSYAIQGIGATIVTGIEGDYFNVVGMPLHLLSEMLSQFGVNIL
jgi:septum formation protein